MAQSNSSVTIIGGGPTGLSAALALHARGVRVRVLDRSATTVKESRAVGVNRRSLVHLRGVGLLEPLLEQSTRVQAALVFDGDRSPITVQIPQSKDGVPTMLALPQNRTEQILAEQLRRRGVELHFSHTATDVEQSETGTIVRAQTPDGERVYEADWVLGADGSRSGTRDSLGLDFPGHELPGEWSLFDARLEWPWPGVQVALVLEDGGHVLLMVTLGGGWFRALGTRARLEERVRQRAQILEFGWRNDFGLAEHCVSSYGRGRVWLAGDAAHTHSPVGGQGMNLGIDDAFDFADSLVAGELEAWEQRRLRAARAVINRADRGLQVMVSDHGLVRTLRGLGIRAVGRSAFLRGALAKAFFGL